MKESVGILLKKAENDLKDAKILYNSNEASAEGICFHCQQAVEKYLKAHLVYNNKEINKTHDISQNLSQENSKPKQGQELANTPKPDAPAQDIKNQPKPTIKFRR